MIPRTSRLLFALLVLTALGCGPQAPDHAPFVRLHDGRFMIADSTFFPVVMNYCVSLVSDGDSLWPASYSGYFPGDRFQYKDQDSCLMQLRAEFALIKDQGFNAVRIVGLAEGPKGGDDGAEVHLRVNAPDRTEIKVPFDDPGYRAKYLHAVRATVRLAMEEGLRVILLTTIHPEKPWTTTNFTLVAAHLRHEPGIMAFDLFNEPLYFDRSDRTKKEIHAEVKRWRALANEHAPDHLITIGLSGIRETHGWDPHILSVDFISFHPYEYEPDQVLNEIRWYGRHVRKPWIIGETSLPADNDSVPYADQLEFAQRTLEQVRACGGIGYSWWQFKDVRWGRFHSDFMGSMTMEGITPMPKGYLPVSGTEKPVARVFRSFDPTAPDRPCMELTNYYNYSEHATALLRGRLVDGSGAPIEGGVVLGWNEDFSHSYHTTSDADGAFQLRGDMYFHHWIASANGHAMVRGDCPPAEFRTGQEGLPVFNVGELALKDLYFLR